MSDIMNEALTIDFNCECGDKVTKAWAKDLSKQVGSAFEMISTAINTMNTIFCEFHTEI